MSSKFVRLASGGASALALFAVPAVAEAHAHHKVVHHKDGHYAEVPILHRVWVSGSAKHHRRVHHAMATNAAPAADNSGEVADLKAKLEALQARVDAAEAASRAASDQAAAASAQAQATSAQVASEGAAVNGQIKTAMSMNKPHESWADNTSVTGQVFFNVSNINQQGIIPAGQAGAGTFGKVQPSGTGFDIKRAYLGVDHRFNKTWSASVLLDAQAAGADTTVGTNLAGANVYIKNAYLQGKLSDALIFRVGAAPMPWLPFAESEYGYRFIEQTIMDREKLATANSADWGVHVLGTLGNPKGFNITYAGSAVNGGGYKDPARSNTMDLEGRVALNFQGLTAAVGGYTGKLGVDTQNLVPTAGPIRTASRFSAMVAYVGPKLRLGAEYFWTKDFASKYITGATATTFSSAPNPVVTIPNGAEETEHGISTWASFQFTPKWAVFGRYDNVRPTWQNFPSREENFYLGGIDYTAIKGVDLALVYKHDVLKSDNGVFPAGTITTQDASNLGDTVVGGQGTYDEFGLFGRFAF